MSSLRESNAFHLGYSTKESSGTALGEKTAEDILDSLKSSQAAKSGILTDLEDTALTIPGIGSDRISDSVCNILKGFFIEYTKDVCIFTALRLKRFQKSKRGTRLVVNGIKSVVISLFLKARKLYLFLRYLHVKR